MKSISISLFLSLLICGFSACSSNLAEIEDEEEPIASPIEQLKGTGDLTFTTYAPFSNQPIEIYYHIPENTNSNTPIIFIFHGGGRNAEEYRNASISKANEYGFIAVIPEFSNASFPGGDSYNLGNIFTDGDNPSSATLVAEEAWTFSVIDPIFNFIKPKTNSTLLKYHMIGHSAGGQFAHRLVLFKPEANFDKVVISASGWYTVPDVSIDFPYGLKKSPLENSDLSNLFIKKMRIQVGELDNNPNTSGLRHNQYSDAQGFNRHDRAQHFFSRSKAIAENSFKWTLQVNQGLDHSFAPAIKKAADLLFK
jgi:pimeloyl-ACP methyl ester carboxylesterase